MRSTKSLLPLLALALLASCDRPTNVARLHAIDAEIRKEHADLYRAKSECEAQAIEFAEPPDDCLETLEFQRDTASQSIDMLLQRRAEIGSN